jgi:hypothetical protein
MLGLSSGFFSSKGMTTVPNLSGLSSSAAQSAIISAGLTFGQATSTSSGASSGNNGTVSSSSIASGSLVDYETSISIVLYSYSAPPPPPPPPPLPTLSAPALSLGTSGNAPGGLYFQVINLGNYDYNLSYSPSPGNFEGDSPEYIIEGSAGSRSLTVTVSGSGYNSNSSTIYFTLGPAAPPPPPPPPSNNCSSWTFGNYYDSETCIGGSLYYEAGYYEYRNCSVTGFETRNIIESSGYCCPC